MLFRCIIIEFIFDLVHIIVYDKLLYLSRLYDMLRCERKCDIMLNSQLNYQNLVSIFVFIKALNLARKHVFLTADKNNTTLNS